MPFTTKYGRVLVTQQGPPNRTAIVTYHDVGYNCNFICYLLHLTTKISFSFSCNTISSFFCLSRDVDDYRTFYYLSYQCTWTRRASISISSYVRISSDLLFSFVCHHFFAERSIQRWINWLKS